MTYAIEASGLVKRFGRTTALAGVDLAAQPGTVLGVLGPNGAGKTTAVRILATLIKPDEGQAAVGGFDVANDAAKVRSLIGLTGQFAAVDEDLTGTENLVLIGRLLDLSRHDAKRRATELLDRFELSDAAKRLARTYSGGMRRRLDLAASLVGNPSVIYLDEPTTGLDPRARAGVWDVIRGLTADGVTVLLTTQYLDEADQLADEIAVFDHGRVVATGTANQLKAKVGGQTLVVRPRDEIDLDLVERMVAELTRRDPVRDIEREEITADVTDPVVLAALVQRLDAFQIPVTELGLRPPSLDDVFFALTGHAAVTDEAMAADSAETVGSASPELETANGSIR
jgi:oleandomycin transport system ATP-binding protein